MTLEELRDITDIEGLEYYLCHKNTDWHYLKDRKVLDACHTLVRAERVIREALNKIPYN